MTEQNGPKRMDLAPMTRRQYLFQIIPGLIAIGAGVMAAGDIAMRIAGFSIGAVILLAALGRSDLIARKIAGWQTSLYWSMVFLVAGLGAIAVFVFGGGVAKVVAAIIAVITLATAAAGTAKTVEEYRVHKKSAGDIPEPAAH